MSAILGFLNRYLSSNRRQHRRLRRKYDTIVRDEGWREVFRGRTLDISAGGAKVTGFAHGIGVFEGQKVTVEFLIIPKDVARVSQRAPVSGRIIRLYESEEETTMGVIFDRPLGAKPSTN
ncbi:MAG: PilZ domain-containing protein [Planctomycetes bacterium]|nr:PilZ domain-containing protein [Planctomycetota bacterium]